MYACGTSECAIADGDYSIYEIANIFGFKSIITINCKWMNKTREWEDESKRMIEWWKWEDREEMIHFSQMLQYLVLHIVF